MSEPADLRDWSDEQQQLFDLRRLADPDAAAMFEYGKRVGRAAERSLREQAEKRVEELEGVAGDVIREWGRDPTIPNLWQSLVYLAAALGPTEVAEEEEEEEG